MRLCPFPRIMSSNSLSFASLALLVWRSTSDRTISFLFSGNSRELNAPESQLISSISSTESSPRHKKLSAIRMMSWVEWTRMPTPRYDLNIRGRWQSSAVNETVPGIAWRTRTRNSQVHFDSCKNGGAEGFTIYSTVRNPKRGAFYLCDVLVQPGCVHDGDCLT